MVSRRAELGQWNTAAPVARLAIAALGGIAPGARVIDPTCGDGVFLAAALAAGATRVVGVEIDLETAARARRRCDSLGRDAEVSVLAADALAPQLPGELGLFDVAIGNPPYVRAGRIDPAVKRERARALTADWPGLDPALIDQLARHADIAATCLLRTLRLVRPGGRAALVVSTALLDADGASALWDAIARVAQVEALIAAPAERWFADAAVNPMLIVARRTDGAGPHAPPRVLRLREPTSEVATRATNLAEIELHAEVRTSDATDTRTLDIAAWSSALRAPGVWFAWHARARDHLVPLRELCEVRRGLTTGANDVFYVPRAEARRLRLESRFLAPVVRSPFNGAPAPIAIAPDESPLVAIAVPPDAKLARAPRIAAWFSRHEAAALRTSAARRDPWWSLPVHPARLFFAKAYGPRFVQRLADTPMLADQRVYALHPKAGVDLVALAAVLNALPTALALESLGRRAMGYGVVEWTVNDALELPVLDVRRASPDERDRLAAGLAAIAQRPIAHVRLERDASDRAALDHATLALAPGGELAAALWDGLCSSVALRDRYLLPAV